MRRLVVLVLVGALGLATVPPPAPAFAQEPSWLDEPPGQPWHRDITPYVLGLGAIMGVIAFNIAAPPVASVGGAFLGSLRNIGRASSVVGGRVAAIAAGATPPAVAAGAPAAAAAARALPVVAPLTSSMLAQAQIGGAAAAAAGAAAVYYLYGLLNWTTGLAP